MYAYVVMFYHCSLLYHDSIYNFCQHIQSYTLCIEITQATRLGLITAGRGKPPAAPSRGRGRGRGRGLRGRGGGNHMVVDHRPRALTIIGFTQEEKEELMPHFVVRLEFRYCRIVSSFVYPLTGHCIRYTCSIHW